MPAARKLWPECLYDVRIAADTVVCQPPDGPEVRLAWGDIRAVYVETNDSGPGGADIWWILEGMTPGAGVAFPQGATGEQAVTERLKCLPGFEVNGMNSTENARFLCWRYRTY